MRVTICDTDETLAEAGRLFDRYRRHYGQPSAGDRRTTDWISRMVRSGLLTVYTASVDAAPDSPPIGLATAHVVPASLTLGESWQLRDLYVLPGRRRQGVAATLVGAVSAAASAAGATRLSLVTESDNQAALDLYRRLGFSRVEGLESLSLDLDGTSAAT